MVRYITLEVPLDAKAVMDDPVEDAVLMARIGATLIKDTRKGRWIEYALENVVTGTQFTFGWIHNFDHTFYWNLRRRGIMLKERSKHMIH